MAAQVQNVPPYEYYDAHGGLGTVVALITRTVDPTRGQLWDRLAEHSELASGYEEHFTGPEELDNIHDTDEYLFSDD